MRSNGSSNGAVLFGQALTILRVSRGMNRMQLAEAAGVSPVGIGQYERGQHKPRAETLSRILEALDLPPEAIDRAQDFARQPLGEDGTLPPDDHREEQRKAALRLAQEVGRAVAHCCLAFMELQAGGWEE
jgi:transcriptional regulator with XRE-family HTH domain